MTFTSFTEIHLREQFLLTFQKWENIIFWWVQFYQLTEDSDMGKLGGNLMLYRPPPTQTQNQ